LKEITAREDASEAEPLDWLALNPKNPVRRTNSGFVCE
jgi:hypothetical protein